MLTAERLKHEFEKLRDELTESQKSLLIWPLGLDVLANAPNVVLRVLAERLSNDPA